MKEQIAAAKLKKAEAGDGGGASTKPAPMGGGMDLMAQVKAKAAERAKKMAEAENASN